MNEKLAFLENDFVQKLKALPTDREAQFGKMNVQQMIEHMADAFGIASGKIVYENKQSSELTQKMYNFMMSDRPFRDNTPNPNLDSEPVPTRFSTKDEAIQNLEAEMNEFVVAFKQEGLRVENPFFGDLNFEEQLHLLHKHALHHLRQFGS